MFANQKLFATKRQVCGRFQNDKQCNLLAVDSVDYKVESRKLRLLGIIYPGAENHTHQIGRVIRDLYSPDSFDTRLGEWASANVQPCITRQI